MKALTLICKAAIMKLDMQYMPSINPELDYWEKYKFSMGIAEIFSMLMERLTKNPLYMKEIGIRNDKVN